MDILTQLGGLVLGSVPTIVLFVLLIVAYNVLVRNPLAKVLAERNARTGGAVEQAREAIAAAEQKTALYEEKLRAVRMELQAEREKRMAEWNADREHALAYAREAARAKVDAARKEMEDSTATARQQIEDATAMLSDQILRAVLPAGASRVEVQQ
jgi:F-type H+-transporting ATPase subunit b